MKFIITESRLYGMVIQYLDSQNFVQEIDYKYRGTPPLTKDKLMFKYPGSEEFPIYYNFERRHLCIDTEFVTELMSIFRLEKDIIMGIIDEWFYIKTENKIGIRNTILFMRVDY
jgi:hypothetical protein